ncbi:hypothetical protein MNBD_BACTEROID06-620 [hydrothermal vent metagenome]|uniref:Uncharacterized protein n=1 Tax=hydrothermal vent metagenome TaxID=652676 RepID=A0A3B0V146_9ZZZZ
MKYLLIIILTYLFLPTVNGQVINSMASDKSGMYYYALDSLTKLVLETDKVEKYILLTDKVYLPNFAKSIRGVEIQIADKKFKSKKMKPNEVLVGMNKIEIIRNEVTISFFTFHNYEGHTQVFADGHYEFKFYYIPESRTYELKYLNRGLDL